MPTTAATLTEPLITVAENSQEKHKTTALVTVLVLGGLMLGVILTSVFLFSRQSLRLDEAQSLWQSSPGINRVWHIVAGDVHVPLYNTMLHFWQWGFGNGVYTARLMSLVFFLATIPAMYALSKLVFSRSAALFATTLVAVSPFLNWYGNEIKMYSLMTLVTVINQYYFLSLYKKRTPGSWIGYCLSSVVGIYTHYFFFFVLLTQAIFFFLQSDVFPKGTFIKLCLLAAGLAVCFVPWVRLVLQVQGPHLSGINGGSSPMLDRPTTIDLFNSFSEFFFGFQNDHLNTVIVSLWPLSVLLGFLTLSKTKKISPDIIYFFLAAFLPIVLAFVVSVTWRPLYLSRYLIFTIPALYLFLTWIFSTYPTTLAKSLKTLLIFGMLATLWYQGVSASSPIKENYEGAVNFLNANAGAQDVIMVSAPFTIYPIEYYYRGPATLVTAPDWNQLAYGPIPPFSEQGLISQIQSLQASHQNIFVVLSYNQGYEQDIHQYFQTHFQLLKSQNFSDDLNVYEYKLRY